MARRTDVNAVRVIEEYSDGDSLVSLSERYGCSRSVILRILRTAGIERRTRHEAAEIRMGLMTPSEKRELTRNANMAARGRPKSDAEMEKRAKTIEHKQEPQSRIEKIFAEGLEDAGIESTLQHAVGRYNVDFLLKGSGVIIELFGGSWHGHGKHRDRYNIRINRIVNAGYPIIIIWCTYNYPLEQPAIDYVLNVHRAILAGEAQETRVHVIRGDGKSCEFGKTHFA